MHILNTLRAIVCAGVLLIGGAGGVAALTFDFTGTWQGGPLVGNFSGSFSYEPTTPVIGMDPSGTSYGPASFMLDTFDDGSTIVNILTEAVVAVDNDDTDFFPGADVISIGRFFGGGVHPVDVLDAALGAEALGVTLDLVDFSGTAINSNALPLSYDLADYASALVAVRFGEEPIFFTQLGVLSSLTQRQEPNPVPLPAALPLFAAGLGLLGAMGWRRRRSAAA